MSIINSIIISISFLLFLPNFVAAQNKSNTGAGEVSEIIIPTSANIRNNFNLFYEIHLSRANIPVPSFWYKIIFSKACSFEFTLFPISEDDGYDFYFFKIDANYDFCNAMKEEKIISCNSERLHKIYNNTEQSEKFRANLVDIKPIQVMEGDAIYIEVFSTKGNDCGHILDFRTTDNSFVVKVVNDNCSGIKNSDTTNIGQYKPLVKDEKQAMNILSEVLCPTGKKPVFISSIQVNNKSVSVQKKLEYTAYTKLQAPKYEKTKTDSVKNSSEINSQKNIEKEISKNEQLKSDSLHKNPETIRPKEIVKEKQQQSDSIQKPTGTINPKNAVIKSTADLNSLSDPSPIKHDISTLQSDKEKNSTRLEVDNVLFSLLHEDLKRKSKSMEDQLKEYSRSLKKIKNVERKEEVIVSIKEIKEQKTDLQNKVKEIDKKLKQINKLLREERTKNSKAEESVFSKSTHQVKNNSTADNGELQSDLIYKVQIGVYKNPISTEVFKGLTPIFEESFSGGVKYSAGAFTHFIDAQHAKEYIKSIGLTDAFVVAYYKGERITIDVAKTYEKK